MKFHVVKTACWPCQWKCESVQWPNRDNSTYLYHRTFEEAQKQVNNFNEWYADAKN